MFKKVIYTPPSQRLPLAITRSGYISFNQNFPKAFNPHKASAVNLYWDKDQASIAIVFTKKETPYSFPVVVLSHGKAAYVPARKFFKDNRLDPLRHAASYDVTTIPADQVDPEDATGKAFVIALN